MRDKQPKPDPFQQAEVPAGMQPAVEMRELRNEPFFDWPELPMTHYCTHSAGHSLILVL